MKASLVGDGVNQRIWMDLSNSILKEIASLLLRLAKFYCIELCQYNRRRKKNEYFMTKLFFDLIFDQSSSRMYGTCSSGSLSRCALQSFTLLLFLLYMACRVSCVRIWFTRLSVCLYSRTRYKVVKLSRQCLSRNRNVPWSCCCSVTVCAHVNAYI